MKKGICISAWISKRSARAKLSLSDIDSVKIKFKPKLFFSRIKQEYIREYRRLLDSND